MQHEKHFKKHPKRNYTSIAFIAIWTAFVIILIVLLVYQNRKDIVNGTLAANMSTGVEHFGTAKDYLS